MLFGIRFLLKDNRDLHIVEQQLIGLRERLKEESLVKNPFKDGRVVYFRTGELETFAAIRMNPVYPPVWWWGILFMVIGLSVRMFIAPQISAFALLAPGAVITATGLLWTPFFPYWALWYKLRTEGFKGRQRPVGARECFRQCFEVLE